jgi:putative membrane-bound dehydrogenase-like protein
MPSRFARLPLLLALVVAARAAPAEVGPLRIFPAVPPSEAEATFRVRQGFTMDLLAAEPLVASPVALAYDADGRAYVAEMRDYPYTDKATHQPWKENTTDAPIGRIRLLYDDDGDGRFDRSVIFAEGLSWPTGVCCWQGGVFVTATPDLWYLKDTDGDGRADVRIRVLSGFRKYNIQTVVNNPRWGLDNRITIATSSNGGELTSPSHPGRPALRLAGRDLRLDPRDYSLTPVSGGTARFGQSFDDWGNRFLCSANNPAFHVVFDAAQAGRNPFLTAPSPVYDVRGSGATLPVFRLSPFEPWRVIQSERWLAAQDSKPRRELTAGGVVTSASGLTVYRGAAYPPSLRGQAFVGEVANNVIHRQSVTAEGVTFAFAAADAGSEFVASTDTWFRPVNFVNAPDGTLHVVDMYRETVEHPWSVPDDLHAQLDLTSGRDRGRIYRLAPPGFRSPSPPRLSAASTEALVAALGHDHAWWRETAQRLLFERQDAGAVGPLRALLGASRSSLARLHALWTLDGLGALRDADLVPLLQDPAPGLREHAIRLAASRLDGSAELRAQVLAAAADPAIRVRYQVAFAAGGIAGDDAVEAALTVLGQDASDRWVRAAALGAHPDQCARMAEGMLRNPGRWQSPAARDVLRSLLAVAGAQHSAATLEALHAALMAGPDSAARENLFWASLGEGLRQARMNLGSAFPDPTTPAARRAATVLAEARSSAAAVQAELKARGAAVRLLAFDDFALASPVLLARLAPGEPPALQVAAVQVLAGFPDPKVGTMLLQAWSSLMPAVRDEALAALLARRERTAALLAAIEQRTVVPAQVPPARRSQLLASSDPELRARAARVFGRSEAGTRAAAVENYRAAAAMTGDGGRGLRVFDQTCAACHRLGGRGTDIGPNLDSVRGWDRAKIMLHILDPNREVAPNYLVYLIELRDGSSLSGMISEEAASGLKVRRIGAPEEVIPRQNVARVTASAVSLMPEGLETSLSLQDMSDLLELITPSK